MNQYIKTIKDEISHLQTLSNKGELTSYDNNFYLRMIQRELGNLKYSFDAENDIRKNLFFPVSKEFLFLKNNKDYIKALDINHKNYYAIINGDDNYVMSCVDDRYVLITNKALLDYAKLLFCHLFETDGEFIISEIAQQTPDKCRTEYDVEKQIVDDDNSDWNFFLRISNSYENNIKKFYVGFVNKQEQKVILSGDNSIEIQIKNSESFTEYILKELVSKNIGNIDSIKSSFIDLLEELKNKIVPEIYKVLFFCEDFQIIDSVEYIEKIQKKRKKGDSISADQQQREQNHHEKIKQIYNIFKKNSGNQHYTALDLFNDYLKYTDIFYTRTYRQPFRAGEWLTRISSRIEKTDSIVKSNLQIIIRINALDKNLFSSYEDDLFKYFQDTIDKMVQLIKKHCNDESFVSAFTIQKEFKTDSNTDNFFKSKSKLEKILDDYVKSL
jgi:hypothetical protein